MVWSFITYDRHNTQGDNSLEGQYLLIFVSLWKMLDNCLILQNVVIVKNNFAVGRFWGLRTGTTKCSEHGIWDPTNNWLAIISSEVVRTIYRWDLLVTSKVSTENLRSKLCRCYKTSEYDVEFWVEKILLRLFHLRYNKLNWRWRRSLF